MSMEPNDDDAFEILFERLDDPQGVNADPYSACCSGASSGVTDMLTVAGRRPALAFWVRDFRVSQSAISVMIPEQRGAKPGVMNKSVSDPLR